MILFIDACVRKESRTRRLAERLLRRLPDTVETVRLGETNMPAADERFLLQRSELVNKGTLGHPLLAPARQFAVADTVVIAAPYWDLSFPAALKQYLEQVNVVGVTFTYTTDGIPKGLCKAKRLYYVTTAGGPILSDAYGYGYVRALAESFWQIPEIKSIRAEGLDVEGTDTEAILRAAEQSIDTMPL